MSSVYGKAVSFSSTSTHRGWTVFRPLLSVLLVIAVVVTVAACRGGGGGGTPQPATGQNGTGTGNGQTSPGTTAQSVSAATVQRAAKAIYDQVVSGKSFTKGDVSAIFAAFGLPTVASTEGDRFQAALDARTPVILDVQAASVAGNLSPPVLVSVDDFIAMVNAKGAKTADGSGPLTRKYLDAAFKPLLGQKSYTPDEVVAAFILALGQERAGRWSGGTTDAVWGDGYLDPLQFELLLYAMAYAAPPPAQASSLGPSSTVAGALGTLGALSGLSEDLLPTLGPVLKWAAKFAARGIPTGLIGKTIRFPLGYIQTPRVALCASIILYSYHLSVRVDPGHIFERMLGDPSIYESQIHVRLTFDFKPDNTAKQVALFLAGCDLPAPGYAPNKPLTWKLTGELPAHGQLVAPPETTDNVGEAVATYRAQDSRVPPELRSLDNLEETGGAVEVKANDLLPGWKSYVGIVRFVNGSARKMGAGEAFIIVGYYVPPPLQFDFSSTIDGGDMKVKVHGGPTTLTLVKSGGEEHYRGSGAITHDIFTVTPSFTGCTDKVGPLTDGTFSVDIPLSRGQSSLALYFGETKLPTVSYTEYCPQQPTDVFPPAPLWAGFWEILHDAESSPQGYAITGWKANGMADVLTRTYGRSQGDLTENTTLHLKVLKGP